VADEWSYESSLTWSGSPANPGEAYPIAIGLISPRNLKFYQLDSPSGDPADQPIVLLERVGLPLIGPRIDVASVKLITGIWPMIEGTLGDIIQVWLGAQRDAQSGSPQWIGPKDYIIGTTEFLDFLVSGRYAAVRFQSEGMSPWRLTGYEIEFESAGKF
jgi:hypothetical protein